MRRCVGCTVGIGDEGEGDNNDYCGWCWSRRADMRKLQEGALNAHRPYRDAPRKASPFLVTRSGVFLDLREVVCAMDCPSTGWLIVCFKSIPERRFNQANAAAEIKSALKMYWEEQCA